MIRCGKTHPEQSRVVCNRPKGLHRLCTGFDEEVDDYVDWSNPDYEDAKVTDRDKASAVVREAAAKVTGSEGAERAARSWTDTERALVSVAISEVAQARETFTADDVWIALGDLVPKTMGLSAMLRKAANDGLIEPTDQYAESRRGDRTDHDYGRRLRIWRALAH